VHLNETTKLYLAGDLVSVTDQLRRCLGVHPGFGVEYPMLELLVEVKPQGIEYRDTWAEVPGKTAPEFKRL